MSTKTHLPVADTPSAQWLWDACNGEVDALIKVWPKKINENELVVEDINHALSLCINQERPRTDLVIALLELLWPARRHLIEQQIFLDTAAQRSYADVMAFFVDRADAPGALIAQYADQLLQRMVGHAAPRNMEVIQVLEPLCQPEGLCKAMANAIMIEVEPDYYQPDAVERTRAVIEFLVQRRGMEAFANIKDILAPCDFFDDTPAFWSTSHFGRLRTAWQTQQTLEDHLSDHQSTHHRGRKL